MMQIGNVGAFDPWPWRPIYSCGHRRPSGVDPHDVVAMRAAGWRCFESSGGYLVQCARCQAEDQRQMRTSA